MIALRLARLSTKGAASPVSDRRSPASGMLMRSSFAHEYGRGTARRPGLCRTVPCRLAERLPGGSQEIEDVVTRHRPRAGGDGRVVHQLVGDVREEAELA